MTGECRWSAHAVELHPIQAWSHSYSHCIPAQTSRPGIPDPPLECVFQPFVRLEESRSRTTGGTGLGLSIAANLTHMQHGRIELKNHSDGALVALSGCQACNIL